MFEERKERQERLRVFIANIMHFLQKMVLFNSLNRSNENIMHFSRKIGIVQ